MNPLITAESDLAIHTSGWIIVAPGTRVTKLPVWDRRRDGAARLGHGPMAMWLRARGMRPVTLAEDGELRRRALHIDPFTLPTASMIRDAGIQRPYDAEGRDTPQMRAYRSANSRGEHWCDLHDHEVMQRLAAAKWDGSQAVYCFGKHFVEGGIIVGWAMPGGKLIQNPSKAHALELGFTDYATTQHAACDGDPDGLPDPESAPDSVDQWQDPSLSYAERCVEASYAELARGNLETQGHNAGPRIKEYFTPATRIVGGRETKLGIAVGNWCVAGGCFAGTMALLPGESLPHAYRVSGLEMEQDAKRAGTWRTRADGYIPRPGDWRISVRVPGSWERHGCRVIDADTSGERTVGANEGVAWRITERDAADKALLGYVSLPAWCHDRAIAPPVVAGEPPDSGAPRIPGYIMWPEGKPGGLRDGGMDEVAELIKRLRDSGAELVG